MHLRSITVFWCCTFITIKAWLQYRPLAFKKLHDSLAQKYRDESLILEISVWLTILHLRSYSMKNENWNNSYLKNCANPGLFFIYFCILKPTITNFKTNKYVKKCPSSVRCWDSNSQPLDHESPLITTRPGLPPNNSSPYGQLRSITNHKLIILKNWTFSGDVQRDVYIEQFNSSKIVTWLYLLQPANRNWNASKIILFEMPVGFELKLSE